MKFKFKFNTYQNLNKVKLKLLFMRDFKNLNVWSKAHSLVIDIYRATANFPKEEVYGLTSQIRRSAGSIPTNIAEGCGRNSDGELYRFSCISIGSASELEYN